LTYQWQQHLDDNYLNLADLTQKVRSVLDKISRGDNLDLEIMLSDLCNLTLEEGFSDSLLKSLITNSNAYQSGVTNAIVNIMSNTVFAIGASLLTLFMLMEFISMVSRADIDNMGFRLPTIVMVKFGIYTFLYCNIPKILGGIEAVALSIGQSIVTGQTLHGGNGLFDYSVGLADTDLANIASAVDALPFFSKIFTYLIVFLSWLFVHLVKGMLEIATVFRAFELWILLLFAPIPLATLASQDFRQTALNFLKTFTAVALQSSAILACFFIYQLLMTSYIKSYDTSANIADFFNSFLLSNILYTTVLAMSVLSSGRIVKQMINAI
jgi:hypothetical protein